MIGCRRGKNTYSGLQEKNSQHCGGHLLDRENITAIFSHCADMPAVIAKRSTRQPGTSTILDAW